MSWWTLIRCLLVFFLWCLLASYFRRSLAKYRQGHVGVTVSEEPVTEFKMPAITVCGGIGHFIPVEEVKPWIQWVRFHNKDGSINKYWWDSSVAARSTMKDVVFVNSNQYAVLCNIYVSPPNETFAFGFANGVSKAVLKSVRTI